MPKLTTDRLTRPSHTKISDFDQARIAAANRAERLNEQVLYGTPCRMHGHDEITATRSRFFVGTGNAIHFFVDNIEAPQNAADYEFL